MGKYAEYEQVIKQTGQSICLDKDLNIGEVMALLQLMKECGETAITLLAGSKHKKVRKVLRKAGRT